MNPDHTDIWQYADDYPDTEPEQIGRAMTRDMTKAQLREWATEFVRAHVESHRRRLAREAEDRAASAAERAAQRARAAGRKAQRKTAWKKVRSEEFRQRLHASPAAVLDGLDYDEIQALRDGAQEEFREWCGDGFGAWLSRAEKDVGAECQRHPMAPGDHYRCRRARTRLDELYYPGGWMKASTDRWIARIAAQTRLEVTAELLDVKFALGNGTKVTWGKATVEQHRQYVAMLSTQVAGVAETAARHAAAIRMCEEAGVSCLGELDSQPESGAA